MDDEGHENAPARGRHRATGAALDTEGARESALSVLSAALDALSTPVVALEVHEDSPIEGGPEEGEGERAMRSLRIRFANRALLRGIDAELSELRYLTLADLRHRFSITDGTEPFDDAVLTGSRVSSVVHGYREEGEEFWWRATLAPVCPNPEASPSHWILQLIDVTESIEEFSQQTRAYADERRARTALHIVSQVSDRLVDVDRSDALGQVSDLIVRFLGGWAGFYLDEDGLRYVEGIEGSGASRHHPLQHRGAPTARDALGDSKVAGSGTVVVEGPDITEVQDPVAALLQGRLTRPVTLSRRDRYLPGTVTGELQRDAYARMGRTGQRYPAVMVHAVPGRRGLLGVLVTAVSEVDVTMTGRVLDDRTAPWAVKVEGDATFTELITRRVGTALDNIRFYRREHQLAETLQHAMLPEQATLDGLDVWTYYAPTSEHAQVGGDWYDVLQVSEDTAGVVIGDVVGHDIEAAATMGQLRSVVRAYAYELVQPGVVLDRVDRLASGMRMARMASLVYATFEQTGVTWSMEYARAGHLPAVHGRGTTARLLDHAGGTLVGIGTGGRQTAVIDLAPGDIVVFYTDGLIERRDQDLREGLGELEDAVAASIARDAAGVGEELISRFADASEDDVALVVVRVPDETQEAGTEDASVRRRRWSLPSETASITRARQSVVAACTAWGMSQVSDVELVVSELVANAVLHGWGYLTLRVSDTADGLRIEVEDANPSPPVATEGHPNRTGGYGMQIVERLAEWGWHARKDRRGKVVWAQLRGTEPQGGLRR